MPTAPWRRLRGLDDPGTGKAPAPPVTTVILHIGPAKTGTTYLQGILQGNAEQLAERGVLFPRGSYGDQVRAVLDVLGRPPHSDGVDIGGAWASLVREVHDWRGERAILSQEYLSEATSEQVEHILGSLAPAQVHVVFTAREPSRVIPAVWQTHLRNKRYPTWAEFIRSVREPDDPGSPLGRLFWRQHDPAQVLPPWEVHLPKERIAVVTVPPTRSDPQLLWHRFSQVCGLDPSAYETGVLRTNTSLGVAEAEALRRVNERLDGRMSPRQQTRWVKFFLARDVLERRPDPIPLQLPAEDYPWVAERSRATRDFLATAGYRIVGDLEDLRTPPPPAAVASPDLVDPAAVLDATVDALVEVLVRVRERGPHPHGSKPPLPRSRPSRRREKRAHP